MNFLPDRSTLQSLSIFTIGFVTIHGAEPTGFGFHCGLVSTQGSFSQNANSKIGYTAGTHYIHHLSDKTQIVTNISLTKLPRFKQVSHVNFMQSATTLTEESNPLSISVGLDVKWKPSIKYDTFFASIGIEYSNWVEASRGGSASSSIASHANYYNNTHQINPAIGLGLIISKSASIEFRLTTTKPERPSGESKHGHLLYLIASFH